MTERTGKEQAEALAMAEALIVNSRVMHEVVSAMKEIPVLPSEVAKPQDTNALNRVEFPVDGGVHTYMDGKTHPYKGFPVGEFVERVDSMKKYLRAFASGLFHEMRRRRLLLLLLPLVPWLLKDIFRALLHSVWKYLVRVRIRSERYSVAVREMHRAFSVEPEGETARAQDLRIALRDVLCTVLEFDNAYRYRFQDVMPSLDKAAFASSPTKELSRLVGILSSRERTQEIRDTWKLLRLFIRFLLPFDRECVGIIRRAFVQADLSKVALDEMDQEYCRPRVDYDFAFMQGEPPKPIIPAVAESPA